MSFPRTYQSVLDMVGKKALETRFARGVVRKSGLRMGGGETFTGAPPKAALRFLKYNARTLNSPTSEASFIQYGWWLRRRLNVSLSNRVTQRISAEHMALFWLEGYTEVRIVARVFAAQPNGRIFCGFSPRVFLPSTFDTNAFFPDTGALIAPGFSSSPPTSPIVTPMSAPYAIGPWVSINEGFLNTEVQVALYWRNVGTTGFITPDIGMVEVQVR